MVSDRFIWFGKRAANTLTKPEGYARRAPSNKEVGKILFEFVGTCPSVSIERTSRWCISIEGSPGWPQEHFKECPYRDQRFIEVIRASDNIDVVTRQADPLVNAIADGLQRYLARRCNGKAERAD